MKTLLLKIATIALLATLPAVLAAKEITLTINTVEGGTKSLDEVAIGTNEVAQIAGYGPDYSTYNKIHIIKDGIQFEIPLDIGSYRPDVRHRIAGPATIKLLATGGPANPSRAFCTVQVIPESFPPDKTIIIPADTGGANIILESSTNLIHWTNATPGAYTNLTTHMFFRIRAERIP